MSCWITKIVNQIRQRKGSKTMIIIVHSLLDLLVRHHCIITSLKTPCTSINYYFNIVLNIKITCLNGTSLFLQDYDDDDNRDIGGNVNVLHVDNKLMHDFLHPNAKRHAIWAEAIDSFVLNCTHT